MRFLPKYYSLPSNIPSRELHRLPPWGGDDPEKCLTGRDFITVLPTDGSCRASLLKRRAMLDIYPRTVQVKELDHLRTSRGLLRTLVTIQSWSSASIYGTSHEEMDSQLIPTQGRSYIPDPPIRSTCGC